MTDIVERLRNWEVVDIVDAHEDGALYNAAADEIERLRNIVYQYRDDLQYPPSADSIQRRLKMIDDALEGK
jgi:hypothetical protein